MSAGKDKREPGDAFSAAAKSRAQRRAEPLGHYTGRLGFFGALGGRVSVRAGRGCPPRIEARKCARFRNGYSLSVCAAGTGALFAGDGDRQ